MSTLLLRDRTRPLVPWYAYPAAALAIVNSAILNSPLWVTITAPLLIVVIASVYGFVGRGPAWWWFGRPWRRRHALKLRRALGRKWNNIPVGRRVFLQASAAPFTTTNVEWIDVRLVRRAWPLFLRFENVPNAIASVSFLRVLKRDGRERFESTSTPTTHGWRCDFNEPVTRASNLALDLAIEITARQPVACYLSIDTKFDQGDIGRGFGRRRIKARLGQYTDPPPHTEEPLKIERLKMPICVNHRRVRDRLPGVSEGARLLARELLQGPRAIATEEEAALEELREIDVVWVDQQGGHYKGNKFENVHAIKPDIVDIVAPAVLPPMPSVGSTEAGFRGLGAPEHP